MYFVYTLFSKKSNKFYIGYTDNLKKRLSDHKSGNVHTTYRMPDFKFVYCEICLSKKDAMMRERQLKTGFGRGYLRNRIKDYLSSK